MDLDYQDFIEKTSIQIDSIDVNGESFRYSLSIPFKRPKGNTALVVMMNPSKATQYKSDSTVNNVLKRIHDEWKDVSCVVISNLYPLYETNSNKLEIHRGHCSKNIQKIGEFIKIADRVLLGWGKPEGKNQNDLLKIEYHEKALEVVQLALNSGIKAFKVGELRENLYPKHLGRLSFSIKISPLDLKDLSKKIKSQIDRNSKNIIK